MGGPSGSAEGGNNTGVEVEAFVNKHSVAFIFPVSLTALQDSEVHFFSKMVSFLRFIEIVFQYKMCIQGRLSATTQLRKLIQ